MKSIFEKIVVISKPLYKELKNIFFLFETIDNKYILFISETFNESFIIKEFNSIDEFLTDEGFTKNDLYIETNAINYDIIKILKDNIPNFKKVIMGDFY